jgi:hypothetical protein
MAPGEAFGQLLGHSIYFTTRRMDEPVRFVRPAFALDDIRKIPRYRRLTSKSSGAGDLWWMEWGGELDTVHDTEAIKWELWKVAWGAWEYIKNSGEFADADNLTIDWVGLIPGKRESRRFVGDHILNQKDLIRQIDHPDPASGASASASSTLRLKKLPSDGRCFPLGERMALMLPLKKGEQLPSMEFFFRSAGKTEVLVRLIASEKPFNAAAWNTVLTSLPKAYASMTS